MRGIVQAREDFEQARKGQPSPIPGIIRAMLTREIGTRHFDQLKALMDQIDEATPVKIFLDRDDRGKNVSERVLKYGSLYMEPLPGTTHLTYNHGLEYNRYIPSVLDIKLAQNFFFYYARPIPVIIHDLQHVEHRFAQRTGGPIGLEYRSPDFRNTLYTSLAMTPVLGKVMTGNGQEVVPVIVPHRLGLFLGNALMCVPADFAPVASIVVQNPPMRNGALDTRFKQTRMGFGSFPSLAPPWGPTSMLFLDTFYGFGQLGYYQKKVHEAFMAAINDPKNFENMSVTAASYRSAGPIAENTLPAKQIQAFVREIQKIVFSDDWKEAHRESRWIVPNAQDLRNSIMPSPAVL